MISLRAWVEDHQGWDDYENGNLFIYLKTFFCGTLRFLIIFFPVLRPVLTKQLAFLFANTNCDSFRLNSALQ